MILRAQLGEQCWLVFGCITDRVSPGDLDIFAFVEAGVVVGDLVCDQLSPDRQRLGLFFIQISFLLEYVLFFFLAHLIVDGRFELVGGFKDLFELFDRIIAVQVRATAVIQ